MMAKLGDVCKINMGQSPDSSSYNTNGNGLPFFQGNADFGIIHPTVRTWCNDPVKIASAGDILLSVRAPIGALNIADINCCIGRGLAALTADESICYKRYLWYVLISRIDELNFKGTGSTFKAINKAILAETDIPLVSFKQQYHIVTLLDKISCLIITCQQQIDKLDKLVKSRFIELFGTENEFGKWPCTIVGDVAEVCVGVVIKPTQYYAERGIPAFRSLNIGKMKINDLDWVYFTKEGHTKNQKSVVRENDVLVVRSGAPGTACVVTKKYSGYNAVDIIIAHPYLDKIKPVFLAAFTNMPHGANQIHEKTGGAAQQHFNVSGYKALRIILPPLELQQRFTDFVEQTDKSKLAIQKSLEKLEILKKSLMQKYFN